MPGPTKGVRSTRMDALWREQDPVPCALRCTRTSLFFTLSAGISPGAEWILVQPAPVDAGGDEEAPAPLLVIETDGCRRMVDGRKLTLLGYLSTESAAALTKAASASTGPASPAAKPTG